MLDGGPSLTSGLAGIVARDTPVAIGIRPTDIGLAPEDADAVVIQARVERVEYAGSDVFWDCAIDGGQGLRVRVGPNARPGEEGGVRLAVAPRQLHLFGHDGERLGGAPAPATGAGRAVTPAASG